MTEIKSFHSETLEQWRSWLEKNHLKEDRVLLVRYKRHTGKGSFNQRDAMNEAICFGWIDTTMKRIDDDRYGVTFVRRKETGRWSDNTFARAREMIKQGKMSKFGMEMFELGLTKKTHDHGVPKNPSLSDVPDLKLELGKRKNKKAHDNFEKMAPSHKKTYLRWILSAKLPETRMRRIKQVIQMAEENRKPGTLKSEV